MCVCVYITLAALGVAVALFRLLVCEDESRAVGTWTELTGGLKERET